MIPAGLAGVTTSILLWLLLINASDALQQFNVQSGRQLNKLQGAALLNTRRPRNKISITLVPLRIRGPMVDKKPKIVFTAAAYQNDDTGRVMPFAPTIRVKRGGFYKIKLSNGLVQPNNTKSVTPISGQNHSMDNWWHNPLDTNLHAHGACLCVLASNAWQAACVHVNKHMIDVSSWMKR